MRILIEGTDQGEVLTGAATEDLIRGFAGPDRLQGKIGSDVLQGGFGADTLDGGLGLDFVRGGPGNDRVFISGGRDQLKGDAGNDWLDASKWQDGIYWNLLPYEQSDLRENVDIPGGTLKLGAESDSGQWDIQTVAGFENFIGSASRDFITSLSKFGVVNLRGGNDRLSADSVEVARGNLGDDILIINSGRAEGGLGDDTLWGGDSGSEKSAILVGGKGNDVLVLDMGVARGGFGADVLRIGGYSDQLYGGPGPDIFDFNGLDGHGIMRDFKPGVDRIDISSYVLRTGESWDDLQSLFEPHPEGTALRLENGLFWNNIFVFAGLTKADLSESDFILEFGQSGPFPDLF